MSAIKLKTQRDLEKFLRILAEESISSAQSSINANSEKQRQTKMAKDIKLGIASLREDEPATQQAEPAEKPENPEPPAEPAEPEEPESEPETKAAAPAADPDINPSLDAMIDAIRDMRGGKGTSDTIVRDALSAYYDRLEEAERTALIIMLRSVAGIMSGKYRDQTPPEPNDYDIYTTKRAAESSSGEKPVTAEKPASPSGAQTTGEKPEDTSPPIKIGEPVSEAYRSRIRNLLSRQS